MRKITIAAIGLLFGSASLFAQQRSAVEEYQLKRSEFGTVKKAKTITSTTTKEAVIWSEDFASGIPSTWVNAGFDGSGNTMANALWAYRGTSTTPNNTVGSRGAFATGTGPIASPTASNGFVIFDSDYLDNNGLPNNFGNGPAPAPHVGTLTTPTIDLSNHPTVELTFSSYYRVFFADALVAFSTDNGLSWPDTVNLHDDISVNGSTANPTPVKLNVSCYVGGSSTVKMRFIFDGRPGNQNGNSYYFWMIDDIVLSDAPARDLAFASLAGSNTAPATDIIFGPAAGSTKTGVMALSTNSANPTDQTRDISFDCNVANYGSKVVTNAKLVVEIYSGGTLLTTRTSATGNINPCDTLDWSTLNTYNTPWKPSNVGVYDVVYSVTGDSVNTLYGDTITIRVDNEELGLDFSDFQSSFGTLSVEDNAADGIIFAPEMDLVQSGKVTGVYIDFSNSRTHTGGAIEIAIYDTSGFDSPTTPYDVNKLLGTSSDGYNSTSSGSYIIGVNDSLAGDLIIPVTDGTNPYINLPAGGYSVQITLYSNGNANPIQILNDETFSTFGRRLMFYPGDRWYSGFNSLVFNAPLVHLLFTPNIGIEEDVLSNGIKVGPSPATDHVNVSFENIEGDFTLTMTDITGRVVSVEDISVFGAANHTMSVNGLAKGVYMLNINNGKASITHKISVQ